MRLMYYTDPAAKFSTLSELHEQIKTMRLKLPIAHYNISHDKLSIMSTALIPSVQKQSFVILTTLLLSIHLF